MSLETKIQISYEEMLFRYGTSCAFNLLILKKISEKDYDKILDCAEKRIVPEREFLERVFAAAVKRIGDEKTGEAVERYFLEKHNQVIENREGDYARLWKTSPERCLECMAGKAVITNIDFIGGVPRYNVRYPDSGKDDFAFGRYIWETVAVGDTITIHNKSAIRKYAS